ncbi:MAG TPA: tRNA uridine-5-carboxymethylaminomethyl(34) synthesis enzyme MnmG [Phycisphaerae bacterium]|nr:tRNA uridine-5-carboxymethylaminomethyl(34) synthesis enzyme MnmG [Phycisphaerae bacterium]HRY68545.1 tRNA uridine-5-carboxymethylaminomethyl(34) synthesis enzyme MnmG [Phycisphaerae bacterium]HSA25593.1 tRNA uridine-5-carboxymethylaminomethyl(34) synthesis enzyme MnmG [Phycisphaerae bacterium]
MDYDVVVVGGGHAGTEAAWAAARMGCGAALVTMSVAAIGRMSCNPAIGGIGKGHIVREIDALGGVMAVAADEGGIQFRVLNRSKGPAVWAPRAQADRRLYAEAVQGMLSTAGSLDIIEGLVEALVVEAGVGGAGRQRAAGVRLADGRQLQSRAVVITTGTFLRGLMHRGAQQWEGGRIGEAAAVGLSKNLSHLGFTLGRLKTGTPPRIDRGSIDYTAVTAQPADEPPVPFSFLTPAITRPQIQCWITSTNERTHAIIRRNIHRAPMYSGQIKSRGPRYCPSVEDKVMRFADKNSHQVFLEPEGYDSPLVYCNGIPTSLPSDVQDAMIRSITGLERARIMQYGYAVEYDWVPTDQIDATLETKRIAGLYLAGQINGTSGYEEAAGQGLMAGINAVARIRGCDPVVLGRDEAYIGVMVDDLVTKPPDEPYRMFTSRAEYRLHLRSDNADQRLTPIGRRIGLVDDRRWSAFEAKRASIELLAAALKATRLDGASLAEWLRRPQVRLAELGVRVPELAVGDYPAAVREAVEIEARYAGYLEREHRLIERYRHLESRCIPAGLDYDTLTELRFEAREKFSRFRPRNLGQAARISGISPADITTLALYVARPVR